VSGIVVFYNVLKRDDSPEQVGAGSQAGMTSKEGYSTLYETAKIMSVKIVCVSELFFDPGQGSPGERG
jgi:hypothetical protein